MFVLTIALLYLTIVVFAAFIVIMTKLGSLNRLGLLPVESALITRENIVRAIKF